MAVTLGNNISALSVLRKLGDTTNKLARTYERLSSGMRINRASDDAASLAVASGLQANSRIFGQAIRNINDGVSFLNVADSGLAQLTDILQRQLELASQAANGSYSLTQRTSLNTELQQLATEYNRLVQGTAYNGLNVLSGVSANLSVQAGTGARGAYTFNTLNTVRTRTGQGTYHSATGVDPGATLISAGDFNGDGRADAATMDANGGIYVYLADSSGNLSLYGSYGLSLDVQGGFVTNVSSYSFAIGDQNGDGKLDIGVSLNYDYHYQAPNSNSQTGYDEYDASGTYNGLLMGYGDGTFYEDYGQGPTFSLNAGSSVTGDFNGDGITDYADATGVNNIQNVAYSDEAESLLQGSLSITTQSAAQSALDSLNAMLTLISNKRGLVGSFQSRLATGLSSISNQKSNIDTAYSGISDADTATDAAELIRQQILQQTATQVLYLANLNPHIALDILKASTG